MRVNRIHIIGLIALAFLAAFGLVRIGAAASVTPVFVAGNPSCADLGYDFGFKVDPPAPGTYELWLGGPTVTVTTDGVYFDWTSELGMDAVISKGGPNSNVYIYDPPAESFGDTGLHSPINPNNGNPYGLSHIEFCFDLEVVVTKTAETSFTRTFAWDIEKSVDPATWNLFTGDSGTSEYTVTVTKDEGTDSDWAVEGTISIYNPAPVEAIITDVADEVSGIGAVAVDCGGATFPYSLAPGDTLVCTYETPLPDGTDRFNTATVTTSGVVGGDFDDADVIFGDPTTLVNDTINVDDTYAGDLGSASDDKTFTYERTFTCDEDEGQHDNTATIVETDQSDDASVTVNCNELVVTKDAHEAFTRTWTWTIEKTGDQTELTLSEGQSFLVNYQVTVDATSVDTDHAVSGEIDVYNPALIDATINSVADIVSPAIAANVDCGVTFPYTLVAGDTLTCTYDADLPDATDRINTATATLQNYDYDSEGVATANGTTDFSGTANVDFDDAVMSEIDECIDVSDDHYGTFSTVCVGDNMPIVLEYSLDISYAECGEYEFVNVATFVTTDTEATGSDDHTVIVHVPCAGCTLTPGYWKTHSEYGPAPTDDAWYNLGDADGDGISEGPDETFFLSGKTYYEVLWTPPAGNPYYILAHAYIAAKLNIVNGASSTSVDSTITWSETFFNTYAPTYKFSKTQKTTIVAKATILDNFNNGLIGPGHCDE